MRCTILFGNRKKIIINQFFFFDYCAVELYAQVIKKPKKPTKPEKPPKPASHTVADASGEHW